MSSISNRDVKFDILRIFAAAMVVLIHVSGSKWGALSPSEFNWKIMNFYDCLARSAVPLFFMLSGAFVLKKEIDFKKLYLGKILPLIIVYFIWSMLYAIDSIGLLQLHNIGLNNFLKTTLESYYHLWFIPVLIGIYILQPVLHAFVVFKEGKNILYFLVCFFVIGILKPTLIEVFESNELLVTFLNKFSGELFKYSGYMILGYYLANIKKVKCKPIFSFALFGIVVAVATILAQFVSVKNGKPITFLYGNFSLLIFFEAILLFVCFQNMEFKFLSSEKFKLFIFKLSSLTMGVYLFHPFVLNFINQHFGLNSLSFNPIFSIPVIMFICFVVSVMVTFCMSKIPLIKRIWIF